MATQTDLDRRWTVAELVDLPDDDVRYELADGRLQVSPATQRHQLRAVDLAEQLRAAAPDGWAVTTGLTLPLGVRDLRVPDVVVHRWPPTHPTADPDNPIGVGDVGLVVEVVSSGSRTTDRVDKPRQYAAAGLPLFWRLESEPVLVLLPFLLSEGVYRPAREVRGQGVLEVPWGQLVVDLSRLR